MPYNESAKKSTIRYIKNHQKQIIIKYKNEEYEQNILPVIQSSGLPVATFIKQAIDEKISRIKTELPPGDENTD